MVDDPHVTSASKGQMHAITWYLRKDAAGYARGAISIIATVKAQAAMNLLSR
jgi:hypothetical protein